MAAGVGLFSQEAAARGLSWEVWSPAGNFWGGGFKWWYGLIIGIGAFLILLAVGLVACLWVRRRRQHQAFRAMPEGQVPAGALTNAQAGMQLAVPDPKIAPV